MSAAIRLGISILLTASTFVVMMMVTGGLLPVDHRWHGTWIWGAAWFPLLLVIVFSCVVELKSKISLPEWIAGLVLSYATLGAGIWWHHQSLSLALTQAGFMETGALCLGYLIAIIGVGVKKRKDFSGFYIPLLIVAIFLLEVLHNVFLVLWSSQTVIVADLWWLGAALIIRAMPVTRALWSELG